MALLIATSLPVISMEGNSGVGEVNKISLDALKKCVDEAKMYPIEDIVLVSDFSNEIDGLFPIFSHSSSVMCGQKGESIIKKLSISSLNISLFGLKLVILR